ncbi:3-deoxy-7-phosphoheptulonate synthase [Desulfobacterales bacterium HSG16]|nr:3-deoxy-7-phosphoheptulonate synthase [Desulfobacterales bacterium HSG16]
MLFVLKKNVTDDQKNHIRGILREGGYIIREMADNENVTIGAVGRKPENIKEYESLPGVERIDRIAANYKLASRQFHPKDTIVQAGGVQVGGERITVVAGPCAVESREQAFTIAKEVKRYGAVLFRGGAFKPRTSPYSFQGLEEEGLKILAEIREEFGMGVVTEITSPSKADMMMKYVDVVQVGARNMQNFELLKCVGRMGKPVLLKRGLSATIEEWLMSAEYILSEDNNNVILCERGIRTFEPYTRNTLDLSAIPVIKNLTHLPVVIDPSHATGIREKVRPMARAAIAAGADGLMIEVHHDPDNAMSDGPQSLYPKQFGKLMRNIYVIAPTVGKQVDFSYLDKVKAGKDAIHEGKMDAESVAFLGEAGTFSHKALTQYFGKTKAEVPKPSFKAIFESVKTSEAGLAIVPLENALTGSIHEVYDLLLEYDLKIIGEMTLKIEHHLIGKPGTKIDDIKRILAPPQVLEQCAQFLACRDDWELISGEATAVGVKKMKNNEDASIAAIGSREAAQIHGMEVIEEGIETNPRNFTRFVVIGVNGADQGPYQKSSIIFSTGNKPGSLFDTLKVFADNGVNLVKLESRPIHGKPWEYMFYVDIETDIASEKYKPVLKLLTEKTDFLKILGSYNL